MALRQFLLLVLALCFSSNVSAYNYKIEKGDTLKELSNRFNITVGELIELNGLKGGRIYVGSVIFIPDSATESDNASINKSSSTEDTVTESDTHPDASNELWTRVSNIKAVNNLTEDKLQITSALFIPFLALPIDEAEDPKSDATIFGGGDNDHPSPPPSSEPPPPLRYNVKKGDTLSDISGNFGVTVRDLMRKNGLSDSRLKTGMILVIPSTGTNGIVRNNAPEKPAINYIVKEGDTIEELSKKFHISIDSIRAANELPDNCVTAGEILKIPDSKYEKEPAVQAITVVGITGHQGSGIPTKLSNRSIDEKVIYHNEEDHTDNKLNSLTRRVINTALMFLGVPYKFGGNSTSTGIDCSAYVKKVFGILHIDLPRTARDIYHVGRSVQKSQLERGDLVFFRTYARYPSHVGIYLGHNKFIHASSRSRKVTIDDLDFNYYKKRYIGARRIESTGLFYDDASKNRRVFQLN